MTKIKVKDGTTLSFIATATMVVGAIIGAIAVKKAERMIQSKSDLSLLFLLASGWPE